jgi:hypothetical protein
MGSALGFNVIGLIMGFDPKSAGRNRDSDGFRRIMITMGQSSKKNQPRARGHGSDTKAAA